MSAYSLVVTTTGVVTYPASPQISLGFEPDEYLFINESAAENIFYSFDGINDHGMMDPGEPSEAISWRTKAKKVWFRSATGAASTVRVSASTDV